MVSEARQIEIRDCYGDTLVVCFAPRRMAPAAALVSGLELAGVDLEGARLHAADLYWANLDQAILRGAVLTRADMRGVRATAADFTDAELNLVSLSPDNIGGPADCTRARFVRANLRGAKMQGAVLRKADLSGADLREADLGPSRFGGTADLSGAILTGARLQNTRLKGAIYDEQTVFPRGFQPRAAGMIMNRRGTILRSAEPRDAEPWVHRISG